jgi:hypothetical protein
MRQETDAMAVDAQTGAVHHGPGCGIGGRLIGTTAGKNCIAEPRKRVEGKSGLVV